MAYRSDLEALQARHAALEAEVADRTQARDQVASLIAEAQAREDEERVLLDRAMGGPARRRRRWMWIGGAIAVLALAGGIVAYRVTRPARDPIAEAIDRLAAFTDELCGCPDLACARRVSAAMTKWSMELTRDWQPPPKFDAAQTKRASDLATRVSECMSRSMTKADAPVVEP